MTLYRIVTLGDKWMVESQPWGTSTWMACSDRPFRSVAQCRRWIRRTLRTEPARERTVVEYWNRNGPVADNVLPGAVDPGKIDLQPLPGLFSRAKP